MLCCGIVVPPHRNRGRKNGSRRGLLPPVSALVFVGSAFRAVLRCHGPLPSGTRSPESAPLQGPCELRPRPSPRMCRHPWETGEACGQEGERTLGRGNRTTPWPRSPVLGHDRSPGGRGATSGMSACAGPGALVAPGRAAAGRGRAAHGPRSAHGGTAPGASCVRPRSPASTCPRTSGAPALPALRFLAGCVVLRHPRQASASTPVVLPSSLRRPV